MTDTTKPNGDREAALDRNYRPHRWDHLEATHKKSCKTSEGADDHKAPQLALPRVRCGDVLPRRMSPRLWLR